MNAKRNAKRMITAITHPNATGEMPMGYRDMIITAATTIDRGVVDVEENDPLERLKINGVPLIRYTGKATEGLWTMREEFESENEGIAIPTLVRWLLNHRRIRERWQNGEIAASSIVFVVKGSMPPQSVI
jgi:hypothetical protein